MTPFPPVARFGVAAGVLGLPVGAVGPFLDRFAPELSRRFCVRVGDAGRSLAVATRGAGPDFVERAAGYIAGAEVGPAAALVAFVRDGAGPLTLEARLSGRGLEIALEQVRAGSLTDVVDALSVGATPLLSSARARELSRVGALLRSSCDAVGWTRSNAEAWVRVAFAEPDPAAARERFVRTVEAVSVPGEQRDFMVGTWESLGAHGGVVGRLAAGPRGLDGLAVEYRAVSAENALKVLQTLSPSPELPRRFGGVVGALGTEVVSALEVTYRRPRATLVASFELGAEPVTLPLRRPSRR